MSINKIITRGFGPLRGGVPGRAGPVSQGYGGYPPEFVPEAFQRAIKYGRSGSKRALDELETVIVWAKLIEVNDRDIKKDISGHVVVKVDKSRHVAVVAENLGSRVKNILNDVKITIKRLK